MSEFVRKIFTFLGGTTIIIGILLALAVMLLGNFQEITFLGLGSSFLIGLVMVGISILQSAVFFFFAAHLENQEKTNYFLKQMRSDFTKAGTIEITKVPSTTQSSKTTASYKPAKITNGTWYCKECNQTNAESSMSCKGCGTYR